MDALSIYAAGCSCRAIQRAVADCLSSLSSFNKQDYAGLKAMDLLKAFSSLARMAGLTGLPSHPLMRRVICPGLSGANSCCPVLHACTVVFPSPWHNAIDHCWHHRCACGSSAVHRVPKRL